MFEHEIAYHTAFHYHCLKNCIRQILEAEGIADAYLYIDVSCSMRYQAIPGKSYRSELSTGYNNVWKPFQTFFQIQKSVSDEEAERRITKWLQEGCPVIVAVDSYYLAYRNTFHTYHGSHAIIITGETADAYELIDWYEPYFYRGPMEKSLMRQAWSSDNTGSVNPFCGNKMERNTYSILSWEEEKDHKKLFLYGVRQIYESFYLRKSSLANPFLAFGLGALEKMTADMRQALFVEAQVKELTEKLHDDFFLLSIARKLQQYYIQTYFTDRGKTHEIIKLYETMIRQYDALLFQILKLKMRWNTKQVQEVLNEMQKTAALEQRCGMQLEKLIQELEES